MKGYLFFWFYDISPLYFKFAASVGSTTYKYINTLEKLYSYFTIYYFFVVFLNLDLVGGKISGLHFDVWTNSSSVKKRRPAVD